MHNLLRIIYQWKYDREIWSPEDIPLFGISTKPIIKEEEKSQEEEYESDSDEDVLGDWAHFDQDAEESSSD